MPAHTLQPSKSIRVRLGVIFAMFSAAVAMALTGLLGQLGRRQSDGQLGEQLHHSATEFARFIDVGIYERYHELQTVGLLLASPPYRGSPDRQREVLNQYGVSGRYAWLGILGPTGTVEASAFGASEKADLSNQAVFKTGRTGSYVGSIQSARRLLELTRGSDKQIEPLLDLAMPLIDEQQHVIGVLGGVVSWSWLKERYDELSKSIRKSRTLDVLLVDAEGTVLLAPPESGLEGEHFSARELSDPSRQKDDYLFGAAELPEYKDFPSPKWTVLVRQRAEVAFAPIERLQAHLFLGGLCGTLLAGLAGYWIAGIFTRPVIQLAEAARNISNGATADEFLPDATEDEIGALTRSLRGLFETREAQAQELRQSFRIFTSTFENAAVGIAQIGTDFRWLRVNSKMAEILGYTAEELHSRTFADLTYPDDLATDMAQVERLLAGEGNTYTMEKRYIRKCGAIIWGRLTASMIRDEAGTPDYFIAVVEDITARKRAEDAIRESESRFREMADHTPVLIWTCDRTKHCDWVNRPWLEFTGRALEQELGNGWMDGLPPEDSERLAMFHEAFDARREMRFEHRLRRRDNVYRWMLTQGVPLYRGGEFVGYVGSSSDITENREATETQTRAREAAEAANNAKDEFLAALSHELRTPLNPVLMLASDNALASHLPEEVQKDFAAIHKNIALEARLIDDLLDLTRITRGKLKLRLEQTDAHDLLHRAVELVKSDVEAKALQLELHLDAANHSVHGDPVRLQQVFWNVILNAVKFTPAGGWIRIATTDDRAETLRVTITDDGLGIEPTEMPYIFEKFGQGNHSSTPHRFGGLGLGLSIAKLLVELHNGRIWAESGGTGRGSKFSISLPALARVNGDESTITESPSVARIPLQRILLVEDHEPTRTTLARLLLRRGHTVKAAEDLATARSFAAGEKFDIVISDLGLPDGSGHEFMAEMRSSHGLSGIALSGYGMEEDLQRSSAAGFCTHLIKPVDVAALESALALAILDGRKEPNRPTEPA